MIATDQRFAVVYRTGVPEDFAWHLYGYTNTISQGEQIADDLRNRYGDATMYYRDELDRRGLPTTFNR